MNFSKNIIHAKSKKKNKFAEKNKFALVFWLKHS